VLLNNLATLLSGVRPSGVRLNVSAPSRTTSPLPSLAQVTVQGSFKVSQFAGWLACTICTINNRTKKVNFDLFCLFRRISAFVIVVKHDLII